MNLDRFTQELPSLYNGWGTANPRLASDSIVKAIKDVWAMTTAEVMALLNLAVRCLGDGERHLEIGVLQGATLTGALVENSATAVAVDNFSMFQSTEGNEYVLGRRLEQLGMSNRVTLHDQDFREFLKNPPQDLVGHVGTYFYDGPHGYDNTFDALEMAIPLYADQCLIVIDDYNWDKVEAASVDWIRAHPYSATLLFDLKTPEGDKTWWNGLGIIAWRK